MLLLFLIKLIFDAFRSQLKDKILVFTLLQRNIYTQNASSRPPTPACYNPLNSKLNISWQCPFNQNLMLVFNLLKALKI